MSNIATTLIQTIEADLKAAWGELGNIAEGVVTEGEHVAQEVVQTAEQGALTIWSDFRAIVTAALPTEYNTLKGYILKALTAVENGDLADVETAVLNLVQETDAWIVNIGSATLQAIIAVVKAGVATVEADVNKVTGQ